METIPEASELGSEYQTLPIYPKPTPRVQFTINKRREESIAKSPFNDDIPEVAEVTVQEMWDAIRRNVDKARSAHSPPFSLVDFAKKRSIAEPTNQGKENEGSIDSFPSKHTLLTMSSYLGDYEARLVVVKVPSMWKSNQNERDTANLHALMSTPVMCTLPLMDLLKVRPDFWESVAKCLTKQGFWNRKIHMEEILTPESSPSTKIKVPVSIEWVKSRR